MKYYLDLFSPLTYEAFLSSSQDISGFRKRQLNVARNVHPGDKLICYLTKLSRWFAVLEVTSEMFQDNSPRFVKADDPFEVRFKIKPLSVLTKEYAIPIKETIVWDNLSLTRDLPKQGSQWTGPFRSSLKQLSNEDGQFLEQLIGSQTAKKTVYSFDEEEYKNYLTQSIHGDNKIITVIVPSDKGDKELEKVDDKEVRESIKIQALLSEIGEKMGFTIWIPKNDRGLVLHEWKPNTGVLIDTLPLNYDQATIKTIEQIDVLWLNKRAIARAFEVEHTTSIYSGILRMADLLALQPNMDIKLHLVAPIERREKVFTEIQRPVFSLLARGALSDLCTYLSYESVRELSLEKHLNHYKDKVIEDYEETVE